MASESSKFSSSWLCSHAEEKTKAEGGTENR
jgi:hypothetical protein